MGLVGEKRPRRLSATAFGVVLASALVSALIAAIAMVSVYYFTHEEAEETRLLSLAKSTASRLDGLSEEARLAALADQFPDHLRYTFVNEAGEVLFDSAAESQPASHKDRPEIQEAQRSGAAAVMRRSQTLGVDTIYAACRLSDGSVVRLSEARESFASFAGSFMLPMFVTLAVLVLVGIGASRLLVRHILAPLDTLDVTDPLSGDAYVEMEPMLVRISEQQQMLKQQNAELARAESMRRDFSANVSHEMKTPLQILSGASEVIASGMAQGDQARAFAEMIHGESARMQALIDDVLTLSRIDDPVDAQQQRSDVELSTLARDVMERMEPLARTREVHVRVLGSEVHVCASRELVEQAVGNLISNAIRYSDAGGVVTVSVRKECHSEEADATPEAVLVVRDEGCGIAHDEQEKIFERFYRVDKSRSKETGGTGLGLAIAKHAVEAMGGTITVESRPGQGSAFTIRVPSV